MSQPPSSFEPDGWLPLLSISPATDGPPAGPSRAAPAPSVRALQRRSRGAARGLAMGTALGVLRRPEQNAHDTAPVAPGDPRLWGDGVSGHPQAPGPSLWRLLASLPGGPDSGLPPVQVAQALGFGAMGG